MVEKWEFVLNPYWLMTIMCHQVGRTHHNRERFSPGWSVLQPCAAHCSKQEAWWRTMEVFTTNIYSQQRWKPSQLLSKRLPYWATRIQENAWSKWILEWEQQRHCFILHRRKQWKTTPVFYKKPIWIDDINIVANLKCAAS